VGGGAELTVTRAQERETGSLPRTLARDVRPEQGTVRLQGVIQAVRALGGLAFVVLRDRSGTIQVLAPGDVDLPREAVVEIVGRSRADARAPGGVEVEAARIVVLARPDGPLPFDISKPALRTSLETALDHRALSLRHPTVAAVFRVAAALVGGFREYLTAQGFAEIHTSKLVATATEGGAGLFRVEYPGRPAYLAQSPQLYKQICVGAFERVFEVGPVFRNEPHQTARHLNEYTSLDVEVGFTDLDGLLALEADLLRAMLEAARGRAGAALDLWGVSAPPVEHIPRLRLAEAKERLAPHGLSYRPEEDLDPAGERFLGRLLLEEGHHFVFVTHYPAAARPFYALPDPADPALALSFDLLFHGLEVTTGGMRIHDHAQLRENMTRFHLPTESFAGYLEAFACGMPPHGGFAIGLERFAAQLVEAPNLRWASLFPRDLRRLEP
jgi:nondiscriminating aspartyl-tRNA synthetase